MNIILSALKSAAKVFSKSRKPLTTVEHLVQTKSPLLQFGEKGNKVVKLRIKPDITMPVNPQTLSNPEPAFVIDGSLVKNGDLAHSSELGNIAIRLADGYKSALKGAKKEISKIFGGYKIQVRAKGANSVYSKLERKVKDKGLQIASQGQASEIIQDAIGGRIIMNDLTRADVAQAIENFTVRGRKLTVSEKGALTKLFSGQKLTKAELKTAKPYITAIKTQLAEKQSDPMFKKVMVSAIKDALDRNVTTIEKLKAAHIRADILQEVQKSGKKTQGMRITEINNYRGHDGIPYFSAAQVKEFERLQVATGETFDIITCPAAKDWKLSKLEEKAIKESGYTTFQMNTVLSDGSLAEIQIRGSGPFGEIEHIAYDSRQAKNTLSHVYDDYKEAIKSLSEADFKEYNKYLSKCYDYYRDSELGIRSVKPKLPKKFNPILSEESMWKLHAQDEAEQSLKMTGFAPHYEEVELSKAA